MSYADAMARYAELLLVQRKPSPTAHLRLDYSETRRMRSDSETFDGQALWQLAEFDHSVRFHNFLVARQAVATCSGDARSVWPTGITVTQAGDVTVEISRGLQVDPDNELGTPVVDEDPLDWQTWCDRRGLRCRLWTSEQIGATSELRTSLDMLYRHVRTCPRDRTVENKVVAQLSRVRTIQLRELKKMVGGDPQLVVSSVARLLLRGSIFGDLNVQARGEFLTGCQTQSFIIPTGHRLSEVTCLSTANVFGS